MATACPRATRVADYFSIRRHRTDSDDPWVKACGDPSGEPPWARRRGNHPAHSGGQSTAVRPGTRSIVAGVCIFDLFLPKHPPDYSSSPGLRRPFTGSPVERTRTPLSRGSKRGAGGVPKVSKSVADYVEIERRYLSSEAFERDRAYWVRQFPNGFASLGLGEAKAKESQGRSDVFQSTIPESVVHALEKMAVRGMCDVTGCFPHRLGSAFGFREWEVGGGRRGGGRSSSIVRF